MHFVTITLLAKAVLLPSLFTSWSPQWLELDMTHNSVLCHPQEDTVYIHTDIFDSDGPKIEIEANFFD